MLWHVYLRKGMVFIPTVATTDAGFFMDIDPVSLVESESKQRVIEEIKATVAKGNPLVATPARASFPKPVVVKYANVKSWAAFEKNAFCWKIFKKDSSFQLRPQRKSLFRGWEDDLSRSETFDGETAIEELANSIAEQMQRITNMS